MGPTTIQREHKGRRNALETYRRGGESYGGVCSSSITSPAIAEACYPDRVAKLYTSTKKRPRLAAWILLFYALWHRRHIEQRMPEGDVFDVLAAR